MIYCIVPSELAGKLHDSLRRHFREDSGVEVIVERRGRERRSGADRRAGEPGAPATERRRIRSRTGRRAGERRAPAVAVAGPPLPRRLRAYAEQIAFVERLEPSSERAEDLDSARLVTRFQAGDRDAFAHLYTRYFERVYGYLRVVFRDPQEAEDMTQEAFTQVFDKIGEYELRSHPFRAWLFVVVRNLAINRLRKLGRLELEDPAVIEQRRETDRTNDRVEALGWVSDRDLLIFIERLPLAQRQVLTMRFLLNLRPSEIAEVLGRTPNDVSKLQHRALGFLRARLDAVAARPSREERSRCRNRPRQAVVLRERRFALAYTRVGVRR